MCQPLDSSRPRDEASDLFSDSDLPYHRLLCRVEFVNLNLTFAWGCKIPLIGEVFTNEQNLEIDECRRGRGK